MLNNICPSAVAIKILEGVMKGKIIITSNSGNNISLFLGNNDLILEDSTKESIAKKIKLVINNYEKYKKIASDISKHQNKKRSKKIYTMKITELLSEIMYNSL